MTILHGDCREQLATLPDCSVDAIVTDPPYELGFMGKKWDASGIAYDPDVWGQCLRVLKPGGHLLAFGGTRTYHRMTCAIEDAGFEIRDSLHWLYGSGFPKSLDVSKAIDKGMGHWRGKAGAVTSTNGAMSGPNYGRTDKGEPITPAAAAAAGWGTALKPAHEPIVLARKPLAGTVATNFTEYGTGALNIDACRVAGALDGDPHRFAKTDGGSFVEFSTAPVVRADGRWPANIILTHTPECRLVGTHKVRTGTAVNRNRTGPKTYTVQFKAPSVPGPDVSYADANGTETVTTWNCVRGCPVATLNEQSENAARYFTSTEWDAEYDAPFLYVAKPSRTERNAGLDGMPEALPVASNGSPNAVGTTRGSLSQARANFHPTVKPVALIRYLIRLITPPDGTVLDPFLGSGTSAVAAILEGHDWIGCELTDDYLPIIKARVAHARTISIQQDLFA